MMKSKSILSCLFVCVLFLISCGTTSSLFTPSQLREASSLSSRIETFYWDETTKQKQKAKGTLRWVKNECIQLSFRIPFVQSEAMRVVFTPEKICLFNRLEKEYIELTFTKLKKKFPQLLAFHQLEEELYQTMQPKGKSRLKGSQLGIAIFNEYDLFIDRVDLEPVQLYDTQVPKSYKRIDEEVFINQIINE